MNRFAVAACAALVALGGSAASDGARAQTRAAITAGSGPQMVNLPRGTSFAVDLPADARDVIISNPAVAEAMLHSPRRITMIGLAGGETDAVFLDASGRTILALRVRVDAGVSALQDTLARVAPGSNVRAEAVNDSIILTGVAASPLEAERAAQVARAFVSAPEKVMNMIAVAGSDQVTLKVRVVEVQRSVLKQLGVSTDILRNNGIHSYGFGRASSYGVNGVQGGGGTLCYGQNGVRTTNHSQTVEAVQGQTSGTNASTNASRNITTNTNIGGNPSTTITDVLSAAVGATESTSLSNVLSNVASTAWKTATGTEANACLEAFERVGLMRTLAEPNLTSVNGEAANFLAGGEFPVPAGRDREGQISVEYKPYGVGLAFRPVVLSEGRISLQVKVEVSELTPSGGLTIGAGTPSSITLPGLTVRRSENTIEIPSGGSMMIAGLLQESTRQSVDSLPGATNLPVLGQLFRSRDYLMGETELVVIVEPYIVNPTSPDRMQTPADGLRIAQDAQTIFFGQLNQVYGSPAPAAQPGAGWRGPVGYVIE
ncbi:MULTISPECIES: type II and III secretion system protein family protein [Brevundimonas]|uniref:type II and III secretion system protein family protein n=1 Tax=Brevundimonas TaxID=41275 RepID=UPI00257C01B6|nr:MULTISPECIES: type II and III secretion system protein family protein [Brevundimonas]